MTGRVLRAVAGGVVFLAAVGALVYVLTLLLGAQLGT
jgi:hypothetical protein